jgi:hypothetical protein
MRVRDAISRGEKLIWVSKRLPMARILLIGYSGDFGGRPFFDSFGSSH